MTEKQFSQLIKGNQKRYEKPNERLRRALGVRSLKTVIKYINYPSAMSVNDLMIVVSELKITGEELMDFLGGIK